MAVFIRDFSKVLNTLLTKDCRIFILAVGIVFINFLTTTSLQAQVSIPREGFPYCQPFTGNGPFENTILGGERRDPNLPTIKIIPKATGESLQLTPYEYWHSGYAIVDIPFSSQSGIKASFEYLSYGGADPNGRPNADGISFFMFDADKPLKIGYLGGSLAYAPYIELDGSVSPSNTGISGGYVGIGFDERGNFGVGTVGESEPDWLKGLGNSITIRGPENINYNVVDRFVTKNSTDVDGNDYVPENPEVKWFGIADDGTTRVTDCLEPGFRKVFIELTRVGSGYQIKIDMLVNTSQNGKQRVSFAPINYPYLAPERLKIGFGGSTGYGRNYHEIRNVTVNVSDDANLIEPQVDDQTVVMCVGGDDIDKEFKVGLGTSDAFITCLQLFTTNPGSPINTLPPTDYLACEPDASLCANKCNGNYESPALDANGNVVGTFYAELQDLNTDNFNQLRDVVNVRFEPNAGFSGEASVFYNVTDNYGFTSQPAKITITANPFPIKVQDAEIDNPSCDGQQDGRIYDLIVGDLVNGFDYEWLYDGSSIGKTGASVSSLVGGEATFELTGVNLGTYTLNVWNPADSQEDGCYETVPVLVDTEDGTPVDLAVPVETICEGEAVSFLPSIDPIFITNGANPTYVWYQQANRAGGPLVSGTTITMNGNPIEVEILSSGELILKGLKNYAASSTYEFFVEVGTQTQGGTNFCPYLGDVLTKATAVVNPPLSFQVSHEDDWCLANIGEIKAVVTGASDITYSLLDQNDQVLQTNTSGTFSGLSPGDYKVFGKSASLGCSSPIEDVRVEGPAVGLVITPDQVENSYCSLPNGSLSFELSGGNIPYQSILVGGTPLPYDPSGVYSVTELEADQYAITVTDAKGCTVSSSIEVFADPPSNFTVLGTEVCEGQEGSAFIDIRESSSGNPQFAWYKEDSTGGYTLITDGLVEGDVSYHVSPLAELFVNGLSANVVPYQFFLRVTGDKICDQGYIPAEIKVTPGPEIDQPIVSATCYGESLGSIQAQIPGNNYADFEFGLVGDNGVSIPFSKNNGLFENLPSGTYELSIKSSLGCITSLDGVVVEQPAEPISISNQTIERASCGLANGAIKDIQISGGSGNYSSVEWRKGAIDGPISSGDITGTSELFPDTYYLLVTDSAGCLVSFEFEVEELSDPVYTVVPPINVCFDEQVEIRPVHIAPDPNLPPAAFTEVFWYKNAGQKDLISNGPDSSTPSITYTIDDSDWLNPQLLIVGLPVGEHDFYFYVACTGQEIKVDVQVYEIPEIVLSTSSVSCFGGNDGKVSFVSGTSPSYTYSIDSGNPISQSDFESMSFAAGSYNVQVITPAGCPQQLNVTIEGPLEPLAITPLVGINPGCGAPNGKINATITGGWLPYTVTIIKDGSILESFEASNSSLNIDGLTAGIYSLQINDARDCEINSTEIKLVDGPSQILVDNQTVCEGQQVIFTPEIDPATSEASFEWYFDSNTSQKINSSPVPDSNGVTYEIDKATGILTITGLATSNNPYHYYVLAQGPGVCPGYIGNATTMVYSTPIATYTTLDEVCFEEGGSIDVKASGGSGLYTFILDGQLSQNTGLFKNVPKGTHSITITTPETCELILKNIEINGPASPLEGEIIEVKNPSCELPNGAVTLGIKGGISGYSVEVFKDSVSQLTVDADLNGEVVISNIGKGEYSFQVTDAAGCIITLSEPLNLVEVPTQINLEDQVICEGGEAVLKPEVSTNVNSPTFTWFFDQEMTGPLLPGQVEGITYQIASNGELTVTGLTESPDPYIFYVMVEGPEICGITPKKVQVFVNAYPNLRVSNPSIVCDPEGTVDLTDFIEGYNPSTYEYNIISPLGTALVGNELNAVNESGNYEVSSSFKGNGCWTAPQRILVRISGELLQSDFQYHADYGGGIIVSNKAIQLLENVDFEDLSTGEVLIWEWDFGDGSTSNEQNPSHIFQNKGTHTISLTTTDSIGCQSVYTLLVNVKDDYLLMMPNAFTPDGVKNQHYKPKHRGIASLEFYVFTTWGELIYESNSLEDLGWDGTLNGKLAPNGNYVYKVKYRNRSGNEFDEAGVFILIR